VRIQLYTGVNKGAPIWISALQMAEAWGVPPWEIMEHPGSLMWAARWAFYQKQAAWVREQKSGK